MRYHIPIKQWAEHDKPREKLLAKGSSALSDSELLAIILRTGSSGKSALELARSLLGSGSNSLYELALLSPEEMNKFNGMGPVKSVTLQAVFELGKRLGREKPDYGAAINGSSPAYKALLPVFESLRHEEMHVMYLNRANKPIKISRVSQGGLSSTIVDVRIILREALICSASGIIVAHNHPSGSLMPSKEDRMVTRKIFMAVASVDLKLLDHLILSEQGYYSFADEGLIS